MIFISASAVKDYLRCNRLLWYRTFAKGKSEPSHYLLLGSLAHKVIEDFDTKWTTVADGIKYAEMISGTFDLNFALVASDIEVYVNTFVESLTHLLTDGSRVEEFFKIPLEYKDTFLVGKYDVINTTNDTIIDWKTTKKLPSTIKADPQFIIYDYAFRSLYGRHPNQVLLASLRTGKVVRYQRDEFLENILMNEVVPSMIADLKSKNFPRNGVFTNSCYNCPFFLDCWSGHNELDSRKHFAQI